MKVFIVLVNGFIMFPFVAEPNEILRGCEQEKQREHIIETNENEF